MTARELLDFLRSDRTDPIAGGTVWRDPGEGTYLVAEDGRTDHPRREGYEYLGTVAGVKEVARPDAPYRSEEMSGKLMWDLGQQIGRERERTE